eukprot:3802190-Prymnesium_polylepis.2
MLRLQQSVAELRVKLSQAEGELELAQKRQKPAASIGTRMQLAGFRKSLMDASLQAAPSNTEEIEEGIASREDRLLAIAHNPSRCPSQSTRVALKRRLLSAAFRPQRSRPRGALSSLPGVVRLPYTDVSLQVSVAAAGSIGLESLVRRAICAKARVAPHRVSGTAAARALLLLEAHRARLLARPLESRQGGGEGSLALAVPRREGWLAAVASAYQRTHPLPVHGEEPAADQQHEHVLLASGCETAWMRRAVDV